MLVVIALLRVNNSSQAKTSGFYVTCGQASQRKVYVHLNTLLNVLIFCFCIDDNNKYVKRKT